MNIFCLQDLSYSSGTIFDKYNIQLYAYPIKRSGNTEKEISNFIDCFSAKKPDFFLFSKDEQLSPTILKTLKSVSPNTKFIMRYWDQRGGIPPLIRSRLGLIDILLINNEDEQQFKMYKDAGIQHVFTAHHGIPPNEFQEFACPITNDVFFGGNNFNHKKFPLSAFRYTFMLRVHKVFNLIVYGNGWPFKTRQRVPRHIYARVLRAAHINLGMNHYGNVVRYYDRRLFECMGSGRLHITHYIPGMEKDFENGKHLVWFRTIPEGLNLIQKYLKYPAAREQIAANGRKLVLEQHSFEVRALQLKEILERV